MVVSSDASMHKINQVSQNPFVIPPTLKFSVQIHIMCIVILLLTFLILFSVSASVAMLG